MHVNNCDHTADAEAPCHASRYDAKQCKVVYIDSVCALETAASAGFTLSQKTQGRMNVMGVKPAAPMRPIKSAKNGRQMATKVVTITYRLRTTARISLGCFEGHI